MKGIIGFSIMNWQLMPDKRRLSSNAKFDHRVAVFQSRQEMVARSVIPLSITMSQYRFYSPINITGQGLNYSFQPFGLRSLQQGRCRPELESNRTTFGIFVVISLAW
jgi:hypothetical protein